MTALQEQLAAKRKELADLEKAAHEESVAEEIRNLRERWSSKADETWDSEKLINELVGLGFSKGVFSNGCDACRGSGMESCRRHSIVPSEIKRVGDLLLSRVQISGVEDFFVPAPPPLASGTIQVQLEYGGRSVPLPAEGRSE